MGRGDLLSHAAGTLKAVGGPSGGHEIHPSGKTPLTDGPINCGAGPSSPMETLQRGTSLLLMLHYCEVGYTVHHIIIIYIYIYISQYHNILFYIYTG